MAGKALITKEMLTWARIRSIGDIDNAAIKLKVNKDKLLSWEKGESLPTFRQARVLAKKLKIPLGYLYLSEPPDESLPIPDLRVKPGTPAHKPSPDFLEVLYDAMRKQEWYRDYVISEDAGDVPFVSKYSLSSPIDEVAKDIRETLNINNSLRRNARNNNDYYSKIVERAELSGVLVLRSGIVGNNTRRPLDANEFQGFAMSDKFAPLVFVNQNDYLSAQIFTLMHELSHIWMGVSGVSVQDYLERPIQQNEIIQDRANEIAAEVLVPMKEFIPQWQKISSLEDGLIDLHRYFRVSAFVILKRAYSLGELPFEVYRSQYNDLRIQIKSKKKKKGGGGYAPMFTRNSTTLATTVLNSISEGKILPIHASNLLNVRPTTLYNMQEYMIAKGASSA